MFCNSFISAFDGVFEDNGGIHAEATISVASSTVSWPGTGRCFQRARGKMPLARGQAWP